MSTTGKVISWVVIAVIVIGGIWWWIASQSNPSMAPAASTTSTTMASTTSQSATSTATSTSYPQGDSDQSIDQDMTNVNTQMNGLNSDNASVTQSMNDQPVQQAE